jgi:hypothetical protein
MLIQPEKKLLGDKYLKDAEAVAKIKEDNKRDTAKLRIPNQDLLEDKAAALGIPMQPSELVMRLQKMNPKIIIQPGGVRNAVAVRYPMKDEKGEDINQYVTGFYIDNALPEYSCVVTDERGLPWREVRGWRSVLTALIRQGIITEKQCDLSFGKPGSWRSILWDKQRQAERNNGHERKV